MSDQFMFINPIDYSLSGCDTSCYAITKLAVANGFTDYSPMADLYLVYGIAVLLEEASYMVYSQYRNASVHTRTAHNKSDSKSIC